MRFVIWLFSMDRDSAWIKAARIGGLLIVMAFGGTADAQQPSPSPEVQALQAKLMQEISASLSCTTQAITLQAEVKRLKDKYEPEVKK